MIRISNINDLDIIIEYKLKMFKDAGVEKLLKSDCKPLIYSTYYKLYLEGKAVHFLAEENDKVIAMSGAFIKDDIPYCFYKISQYGFIGDMYTIPEYRKNGYASRLLDYAIGWLKEKSVVEVKLLASEEGRGIYENAGFIDDSDSMKLNCKSENS